jgi:hypothetical protein
MVGAIIQCGSTVVVRGRRLRSYLSLLALFPMSQVLSTPSTSTSTSPNFQSVLNAALEKYENKTKNKLLTHPLAAQLQSCNSPAEILSVLEGLVRKFDQRRASNHRLQSWLNPTVNVLYAFSATLGAGVGLVNLTLSSL